MPEETFDPELNALQSALADLVPRTTINRDQVLFRAGQASVRGRRWLWPSLAAAWCGLALGLGAALVAQRNQEPVERVVWVKVPVPAVEERTPTPSSSTLAALLPDLPAASGEYLQLRQQVVRFGADALPDPPATAPLDPPVTVERILDTPDAFPTATPSTRRTPS
jgi:hypothetical protein